MSWKVKKLEEVCTFTRGLTYKKSDEAPDGDIEVLRANNIELDSGLLNFDEIKRLRSSFEVPPDKLIKMNSLIICTASGSKSHLGKAAFVDKDYKAAFGGFLGMLTPSDELIGRYLFHLMQSKVYKDFIASISDGANINNLRFNQLAHFDVPIPTIEEQKRIVAILDAAFEQIDQAKAIAQQNLQNAREIFDSALKQAFNLDGKNWQVKNLGDVCDITGGGTPSKSNPEFYNGDIPWATVRDMRVSYLTDTDFKISLEGLKRSSSNLIPAGNVIIATRVGLGKVCVLGQDTAINQDLRAIVPKDAKSISRGFLFWWLNSISNIIEAEGTGATVKGVKLPFIKKLAFPCACIEEQKRIAEKLGALADNVKELESIYQQKITALDELKQSLLQQAFSGQLTAKHSDATV